MEFDNTPYDPQEIELETYKTSNSGGYWHNRLFAVMNNFHLYFAVVPGGDTYYGQYLRNDSKRPIDTPENFDHVRISSRYAHQTRREFIEEIEKTAQEVIGSIEVVREVVGQWSKKRDEENSQRCFEVLVQIYVRLRQNGYAHYDLWG